MLERVGRKERWGDQVVHGQDTLCGLLPVAAAVTLAVSAPVCCCTRQHDRTREHTDVSDNVAAPASRPGCWAHLLRREQCASRRVTQHVCHMTRCKVFRQRSAATSKCPQLCGAHGGSGTTLYSVLVPGVNDTACCIGVQLNRTPAGWLVGGCVTTAGVGRISQRQQQVPATWCVEVIGHCQCCSQLHRSICIRAQHPVLCLLSIVPGWCRHSLITTHTSSSQELLHQLHRGSQGGGRGDRRQWLIS
jgi:hypothetical protein